ncbi:A/G-specific adenine glycosylase [Promethearchaeum syntrophicum]|uniref:A/G-specific adenine glycosylase n=1 Tax=Promethearchaeum syntrophicum TaxID=2594042 RepID=A0A5B9DD24_9ARCH|nr:A/G-specific adenine glycosylase [Candidatus Prometheoarchaeum syntrophicum]QEE17219.1 G/T mismatches repair enzyme [Candidatus Prometheoarchaeum syntrophicum]
MDSLKLHPVPSNLKSIKKWNLFGNRDEFRLIQDYFSKNLIEWFKHHGRDLPWRQTRDPYKILLSEIMLQQTQVDRVIEYYHQFLDQIPDFATLEEISEDTVIELWKGLGYYNRARNLQKIAKIIMNDYDGMFPSTKSEILALPGIGEYTTGAVMTFALNIRAPLVDTNVERVYRRIFLQDIHIQSPSELSKIYWFLADQLLPDEKYWEFNQGIMDFGAVLCKANSPICNKCFCRKFCRYYSRRSLSRFL